MDTLEPILKEHPFLKGLGERHLDLIVGCASNVRFDPGEYIFRENEVAEQFYIIREGKVALGVFTPERGAMIIDTLGTDDILGWSWLIPPYNWRFDALALDLTRAIALDGKCLREKCEKDHDLGYELLKRFALIIEHRLESARIQLLDVYAINS